MQSKVIMFIYWFAVFGTKKTKANRTLCYYLVLVGVLY